MSTDFDHVVLTRFNLPSKGYESVVRAHDGWLHSRVGLFEKYCLPSMRSQTASDATWIIYFDPGSPAWLKDWIDGYAGDTAFTPVFRAEVSTSDLLRDITFAVGTPRPGLITTNLDNDDAIARDFLERIEGAAAPGTRSAIYVTHGLIASSSGVYKRRDRLNAFCSVAEPWSTPVTCWSAWHNRLSLQMPVTSVSGAPGWLQVIHGDNVSNRVRGRLVTPGAYSELFPGLLDEAPVPSQAALLKDRLAAGPARASREAVRRVAKGIATALFGTSGLDALKLRFARGATSRTEPESTPALPNGEATP